MYAVIEMKGHQYIIKDNVDLVVDNIDEGDKLICEKVLMVFNDDCSDVFVGKPYLRDTVVEFERIENRKGDKIRVLKFHRKNRYSKVYGFRPHQTILRVKKILNNGK